MKTSFTALLSFGLLTACNVGLAVTAKTDLEPLFLNAPKVLQAKARPAEAHAQRSRVVQLNPRLLQPGLGSLQQPGARLTANLFDDQDHVVVVDKVEVKGPDEFVCFGRVEGYPDSYVILASVDGAMAGTITLLGQAPFQVQYVGDGFHQINEIGPLPVAGCTIGACTVSNPGGALASAARDSIEPFDQPDTERQGLAEPHPTSLMTPMKEVGDTNPPPVVIDFLMLYTPKALEGAGGEAGINALIDFAIAQANFCYANSQVNVRWNIANKGLVNYTDSGNVCTDAGWLESNASSLRSAYRADLAVLITELDTVGISGCARTWGTAFLRSQITAGYLVVHEVSHLLGAGHDRLTCQNQPGNCGNVYAYSYGHRFVADA